MTVYFESSAARSAEARPTPAATEAPDGELGGHDEELAALRTLHEVLLRYPMAAQAAFSALVAEGRRFATTEEGEALLARMGRSPHTARARVLWEVLTTSGMTEKPAGALPGVLLDKLARTLVVDRLEPMLARLFERRL